MENDLKQSDQARLEKERAVSEARVNLDESKEEYLNEFKWASKTSMIPAVMGDTL